jgi:hypothetical protein
VIANPVHFARARLFQIVTGLAQNVRGENCFRSYIGDQVGEIGRGIVGVNDGAA